VLVGVVGQEAHDAPDVGGRREVLGHERDALAQEGASRASAISGVRVAPV
jgi:hypothetical protein